MSLLVGTALLALMDQCAGAIVVADAPYVLTGTTAASVVNVTANALGNIGAAFTRCRWAVICVHLQC